MLGISVLPQRGKVSGGIREQLRDLDRALVLRPEIHHAHTVHGALCDFRPADHEREARPLLTRVSQRLLERTADDVTRHGPAVVTKSTRERERARLLER